MITDDHQAAMTEARYRRLTNSFLIGIALCLVTMPLWLMWWKNQRDHNREQLRARDLPITIKNAEPIIAAIKSYKKEKGKFPASLDALIPHYIERLPDAGPVARTGWQYSTDDFYGTEAAGGWALFVQVREEYSPNVWGFGDSFAYHPSGKYPKQGYSGVLVPFQNWGYYIE